MRLFLSIFVLLLCSSVAQQAPPPSPRKGTDSQADTHHNIGSQASSNEKPPTELAPLVKAGASQENKNPGGRKAQNDEQQQTVKISEIPQIKVTTGLSNIIYLVFSGLLVAVGWPCP